MDYASSPEVAPRFPEIAREAFDRAFQLVLPDGRVLDGAAAVLATLERTPGDGALSALARVPILGILLELAYRLVASHRPTATALTRLLWGRSVEKPTYFAASALFLRALGLCYLTAFVSLWVQVDGLIGARGILPVGQFLDWVRSQTGSERYWLLPTLCWISSSDAFLHLLCGGGVFAALLLVVGLAPAAGAALAWLLYLSLAIAGQVFLQFQWDYLLLETGLLAIFVAAPWRWRVRSGLAARPSVLFLLRWLLFRLMFSSGWVKLASGDPTWRNLTALRYHYATQPLPPWTAWFLHQCPPWFQTVSALFLLFVELIVPFLYFAPRRLRLFAFRATVLLQLLIAASGNYGFFNLLALALALRARRRPVLAAALARAADAGVRPPRAWPKGRARPGRLRGGVRVLDRVCRDARPLARAAADGGRGREAALRRGSQLQPVRPFMVMTTERPEILIEGAATTAPTGARTRFRGSPETSRCGRAFIAPAPAPPRLAECVPRRPLKRRRIPGSSSFSGACSRDHPKSSDCCRRILPDHPPRYGRATLFTTGFRSTDAAAAARRSGARRRGRSGRAVQSNTYRTK